MLHGAPSDGKSHILLQNIAREAIETSIKRKHRCLFAIPRSDGEGKVAIVQNVLTEARTGSRTVIHVLWCTKYGRKSGKRPKAHVPKILDTETPKRPDIRIRYCQYRDTVHILGNTYDMVILDDFESISPNYIARVAETANGGGVVALLLPMFRLSSCVDDFIAGTSSGTGGKKIKPFLRRVVSSLGQCRHVRWLSNAPCFRKRDRNSEVSITGPETQDQRYFAVRDTLMQRHGGTIGPLCDLTSTDDQGMALVVLARAIFGQSSCSSFQPHDIRKFETTSQVNITAGRGRGKSAVLGLAIALALHSGQIRVFVLAPSLGNVKTVFEFVVMGLRALGYDEHRDCDTKYGQTEEESSCIRRILFRGGKLHQTAEYISPEIACALMSSSPAKGDCWDTLGDLWVIDEAAALPVELVLDVIRRAPLRFLSSTVFGYEGSGRSLVLKVLKAGHNRQIIEPSGQCVQNPLCPSYPVQSDHISLHEPIRYAANDPIEEWMSELFCFPADFVGFDASVGMDRTVGITRPPPEECTLLYVEKSILFSYTPPCEAYLRKIMHILFHAHYRNQPDDLQVLCDSPNHHLFVLVRGTNASSDADVLCVIQAVQEGGIDPKRAARDLATGIKPTGDMMPYAMYQNYENARCVSSRGLRIIRIAVHPDVQRCGYGSRALSLLIEGIEGFDRKRSEGAVMGECITRSCMNLPLFNQVSYVGAMFGVTVELFNFWTKLQFSPVYLRQQCSKMTGERSILVIRPLRQNDTCDDTPVLSEALVRAMRFELRRRYVSLVPSVFGDIALALSAAILTHSPVDCMKIDEKTALIRHELTLSDLTRLEAFVREKSSIMKVCDLIPRLARLYFMGAVHGKIHECLTITLSELPRQMLLAVGLHGRAWNEFYTQSPSTFSLITETQDFAPLRESIEVLTNALRLVFDAQT